MRLVAAVAVVLTLSALDRAATAAAPIPPPPKHPTNVGVGPVPEGQAADYLPLDLLSLEPDAGFEVYGPESEPVRDRPIVACAANCQLHAKPGRYRILITETDDTVAGFRDLDIHEPTTIRFEPDTKAKRTVGLVLGLVGAIVLGVEATRVEVNDGSDDLDTALLLGGAPLTAIGWVMFGTSSKPEYEAYVGSERPLAYTEGRTGVWERFTLDAVYEIGIAHRRTFVDAYAHDPVTGRSSSAAVDIDRTTGRHGVSLTAGFSLRPTFGLGLEGSIYQDMSEREPDPFLDRVGVRLGARRAWGIGLMTELRPGHRNFGERDGWFFRSGL